MTGEFEIDSSGFLPLREVVYDALRKAILKEKLKPGERLMENTIAMKLGVSRTPVREAIRMLADEGLVVLIPRRGAQVAQISRQELLDVLEIRESLDVLAVVLCCQRITPEQEELLDEAERAFRASIGKSIAEIAEKDIVFHDAIYTASGNRKLVQILNNLREQMYRFRLEYLKQIRDFEEVADEHGKITAAIHAKDIQAAVSCIREHIERQIETIGRTLPE